MDVAPSSSYPDGERMAALLAEFRDTFGCDAGVVVRVPGRVNLIGEHVDYCGYAVHPMAIEQDVLVAVTRATDSKIVLRNSDGAAYGGFECAADSVEIRSGDAKWWNYFLCGVKGVAEDKLGCNAVIGMKCLVDGKIPRSAGLSSSSALVVSAAICKNNLN